MVKENIDKAFENCLSFLNSIGIKVWFKKISCNTFLPGLQIENGELFIDRDKLLYPGDILHEAGHIAVVPSTDRINLNSESIMSRPQREAEEMMAIAWSYAVCCSLRIDPSFVFHENGYKGNAGNILYQFNNGCYFGAPMLAWCDMTIEPERNKVDQLPFPAMLKWMRE